MLPRLGLQLRLSTMLMLVALVPYSIVMAFAFHLDGASPEAVGICLVTLLPSMVIAFLLGQILSRWIFQAGAEQMRLFREERDRNARLAELDRLHGDFFASASHELRTPLSSLIMFLDGLDQNWDQIPDAERRSIVGRVRPICRRMSRLVSDLLLAAEIQSGEVPIVGGAVDLNALVMEACAEVAAVHPSIGIDMTGGEHCTVWADAGRVQQIVVNLLDNAAKFSEPGVPVRIEFGPIDGSVMVRVRNRGPAIPADDIPDLFLPFKRTVAGRQVSVGTGLGLHVCKRLVEAMGGQIWVESAAEETAVAFSLPARNREA